jgi:hypothetical protein
VSERQERHLKKRLIGSPLDFDTPDQDERNSLVRVALAIVLRDEAAQDDAAKVVHVLERAVEEIATDVFPNFKRLGQ